MCPSYICMQYLYLELGRNRLLVVATHCNTHYNTLQHTLYHCNTPCNTPCNTTYDARCNTQRITVEGCGVVTSMTGRHPNFVLSFFLSFFLFFFLSFFRSFFGGENPTSSHDSPGILPDRCPLSSFGTHYGVATISRLLKMIGLFCKRAL